MRMMGPIQGNIKAMAERVLISLEDVTLSFGGKPLFEGLRVHVCEATASA